MSTPATPPGSHTAWLCDIGRVRSENQDACREFQDTSGCRLLVVADGMGGHQGGATASRLAVDAVGEVFGAAPAGGADTLRRAIESANSQVYAAAGRSADLLGMGTTCVALLFGADGSAWVAHVGDSRAYRLRDGRIEPLTADHSAVAELMRRGLINAEEAAVHPRRHELLRSVGVDPSVEVEVASLDARPGDRFLLCSDGLTGVVSDTEIGALLGSEPPERAARRLVDMANERGGPDNITVMICALADAEARRRADSREAPDPRRRQRLLSAGLVALLLAAALLLLMLGDGSSAPGP